MLKEIIRLDDAGQIALAKSILSAEEIDYVMSDSNAASAGFSSPARILVHSDDLDRAIELLISAGFKQDIYPMKKPVDPNDS